MTLYEHMEGFQTLQSLIYAPKSMIKHEKEEYGMKKGGIATSLKAHAAAPASKAHAGMKDGGYVRSADGIAKKGKTKGTMVAMKRGGMCK